MYFQDGNYHELALLTEGTDFKAIRERFLTEFNRPEFSAAISDSIKALDRLDVLKKAIFYGKNFKTSDDSIADKKYLQADRTLLRTIHAVLGIATEAGELLEALVNLLPTEGDDEQRPSYESVISNISEELGDILWYMNIIQDNYMLDEAYIKNKNLTKLLCKRYGASFSEHRAINRDIEAETEVLMKGSVVEEGQLIDIDSLQEPGVYLIDQVTGDLLQYAGIDAISQHILFGRVESGESADKSLSSYFFVPFPYYSEVPGGSPAIINPATVHQGKIILRYSIGVVGIRS